MKRIARLSMVSTLALILMSAVAPGDFALAQTAADKAGKIDQLMTEYFRQGAFNGSSLVAERGKVIFKKATGLPTWNGKSPTRRTPNSDCPGRPSEAR